MTSDEVVKELSLLDKIIELLKKHRGNEDAAWNEFTLSNRELAEQIVTYLQQPTEH